MSSYMWRLWEVLAGMGSAGATPPVGLSLLDTTPQLAAWSNPTQPRPLGAGGSRASFVRMALSTCSAQCVVVGHLYQAPAAWLAWRRQSLMRRVALRHAHAVVTTTK